MLQKYTEVILNSSCVFLLIDNDGVCLGSGSTECKSIFAQIVEAPAISSVKKNNYYCVT